MVINPHSSKLLQIKVKVIPEPHARKEKLILLLKKNLSQKRDTEMKNFTVHSILSCFSCRWLINLIMRRLTDGAAAVSAGWACWLKFEDNTDNAMVQNSSARLC